MEGERELGRDVFCGLRHCEANGNFEVDEGEEILKLLRLVADETSFSAWGGLLLYRRLHLE
jgi:hypothetical protein